MCNRFKTSRPSCARYENVGAEIELRDGYVIAKVKKSKLIGNKIEFPEISVGATENAIMAAVLASGETLIKMQQENRR